MDKDNIKETIKWKHTKKTENHHKNIIDKTRHEKVRNDWWLEWSNSVCGRKERIGWQIFITYVISNNS